MALRPFEKRLLMHQLFHADEVRPISEVPAEHFTPERYEDEVRKRIRALIEQKVEGGELTAAPETQPPAKVVDLMEALKASLARRGANEKAEKGERTEKAGKKTRAPARHRPPLRKAG